ncbi:MAG TPA: TonB family protein [Blastocatellia bacterium]|nr:TonB family protein [Blastocatellia bacterium]
MISRLFAGLKGIGDSLKMTPMRPGATGDFKFLLKEEPLLSRIAREIGSALNEFRRNPRVFIKEFVRGEGTNRFRRNALLAGSELALTGVFTAYFLSQALAGVSSANPLQINMFHAGFGAFLATCFLTRVFLLYRLVYRSTSKFAAPKVALEIVNWTPLVAILLLAILLNNYGLYCRVFPGRCVAPVDKLKLLALVETAPVEETPKVEVKAEKKPVKEKVLGGSKPKPQKAAGGGGGGRQKPEPPSKGVPPQMALTPQIVLPNPEPPKIKNPTLPVAMTTYGDPSLRMPKGPIGDPTGVPAPPSPGPGKGDGIGRSTGTGVGSGAGGGAGPGRGGNTGGGDMNIGGGRSVEPMTASLRPTILYREKAKYTEEARQNKIQGTVVLQVVFNVNGSITDVRVIRGLPDGLTEKAIEAAKRIRFNPAVKNGTPVSVRGSLEFTFNLY